MCPYEEIGCMFMHEVSEQCKFKELCINKLCPFKHNFRTESTDKTREIPENVNDLNMSNHTKPVRISCKVCFRWMKGEQDLENHMVKEHGTNSHIENDDSETEPEEDLECEECGMVSPDFDSYLDHRGRNDCVLYCNFCDKTFKDEDHLKKHESQHCVNCCKEFSTQKMLDTHKKKCHA